MTCLTERKGSAILLLQQNLFNFFSKVSEKMIITRLSWLFCSFQSHHNVISMWSLSGSNWISRVLNFQFFLSLKVQYQLLNGNSSWTLNLTKIVSKWNINWETWENFKIYLHKFRGKYDIKRHQYKREATIIDNDNGKKWRVIQLFLAFKCSCEAFRGNIKCRSSMFWEMTNKTKTNVWTKTITYCSVLGQLP